MRLPTTVSHLIGWKSLMSGLGGIQLYRNKRYQDSPIVKNYERRTHKEYAAPWLVGPVSKKAEN